MLKRNDLFLALVVIIIWGLNFIAIKLGVKNIPPLMLGTLRFLFACFPIIFFLPKPPISWSRLFWLSLSINVGQFSFLFLGIKVGMPAGLASLVLQSQAFFTLFFAVTWFGETWRWHNLAGLAAAGVGMIVIGSHQGSGMTLSGFFMTIAAAASWGLGNVLMRRATADVPAFPMLSLVVWTGFLALLPLGLLSLLIEGYEAWIIALRSPSWTSIASITYLSYAATLIGYGIWGKLMSRYPAGTISPLALLVPLVGISSSSLLLGERFSLWQGLGTLLVMGGLLIHVLGGRAFGNLQNQPDNS